MNEVMKLFQLWPPGVLPGLLTYRKAISVQRKAENCSGITFAWQVGQAEDYHLLFGL